MTSPLTRLQTVLRTYPSMLVAFSGGVDSTLLLRVAVDTLGLDRVQAVTALSPLRPDFESRRATRLADALGVRHHRVRSRELDVSEVAGNARRRCYHCKQHVFSTCLSLAKTQGLSSVCDGTNLDDLDDYRPGHDALKELGVRSPLVEAELTKAEVRQLSRDLDLSTWDLPSYSCLATRFPYGETLTPERLQRVERCEDWLREKGFQGFRVRHHGEIARLELPLADLPRLVNVPLREEVIATFKEAGFSYICLDLEGFRSGSMDIHL